MSCLRTRNLPAVVRLRTSNLATARRRPAVLPLVLAAQVTADSAQNPQRLQARTVGTVKTATHVAAHLPVSVPHTVTALLVVTALSVQHMATVLLVETVPRTVTVLNVLRTTVVSVLSVPLMVIVLLVEIVPRMVTVTNAPHTTVVTVQNVPLSTAAEIAQLMVTAPNVHALTAMHHVASAPLTEIAHPAEIVLPTATVMNVLRTTVVSVPSVQRLTAENALSVPPMVTVTNAPHTTAASVPSAQHSVIVLLVATAHRMVTATTVPHVTSAVTVPVTTRMKLLAVPLLTSTLQRMRRHASLLKRTSYSSASKHRQPLLLMSMA